MANNLTAADAVITLTVPGVFNTPVQLKGFMTDNIYDLPTVEVNQTAMGVDGKLSAGFVFNPIDQTFHIQADSDSNQIFDVWMQAMITNRTTYRVNGETTLPALGTSYVSTNGALISWAPVSAAGKILQGRQALIRWESITASPL
ncbi:phage tail fiber protein [Rhizobium sp.]|uniref:phage tail fiber protein n=1 Tax=Rhizobium sp. TaxID=391 RepID=UPI003F801756